ncbi:MAG TPA: neutral/alkaline non-lysosomal ceramidase N-terminal domain-containing protein [Pseudonocardia sp.]|nr:neutral/alkaline non-lysosomal ceramidase N-terminal domain-containing protein [Pseudonocardia sp.]
MTAEGAGRFLVGRGIADITGEAAECGLLGYGKPEQQSAGIHLRLRARAFVLVDAESGRRVLIVVNELPLIFDSIHREVLRRVGLRYGDLYTDRNTMITATHTHCGPGGYAHHRLYNLTTHGFRPRTFTAIVDGMVAAIEAAHADVAEATLTLAHGELTDASANRSPVAWARNPEPDRAFFPDAIDPQTTLLRVDRAGTPVAAINWFATHGTSMTNHNALVSGDNKGYAAYHWERLVEGADYLTGEVGFVAAFAQTNSGDMSPNLNHRPGSGPTEDEFENTRLIGLRQFEAAGKLAASAATPLRAGVDHRTTYVRLAGFDVDPEFTGDGRPHRTGAPNAGAAALAGTREGPGFKGFRIGPAGNPFFDGLSRHLLYRLSPRLRDAQAPKGLTPLGGLVDRLTPVAQSVVPVQLLRLGQLYLIGIPGEVTITAGLRLRQAVARRTGADLNDVLVAGYSNAYLHYVTTPEEYDAQCYEGGSTLFGRWQLPALVHVVSGLATAMHRGEAVPLGTAPPDLSGSARPSRRVPPPDRAVAGTAGTGGAFGAVLAEPLPSCRPGQRATAVFVGAHPNNDLRRGDTYLRVERADGDGWRTVADDGDWSTRFRWARAGRDGSRVTVTWDVPADTPPGRYRLTYQGDARTGAGPALTPVTGTSQTFVIEAG